MSPFPPLTGNILVIIVPNAGEDTVKWASPIPWSTRWPDASGVQPGNVDPNPLTQ